MKEKKDKSVPEEGGFISKKRFLEKKAKDEVIEKPKMVLQPAVPLSLRPHFSSSSLEVLPSGGGLKRKSVADFWTDVDFAVGKAHEVKSISSENASLVGQVTKLIANLVKAQDCLSVLEKDLKTEKAFCAFTDKQLQVALGKIKEDRTQVVVDFKKSDKYNDKSCALYMEGFDIVHTYVRKHHLEIDLSTLDIEEVEKEVVANWAIVAQANDVAGEEAKAPIDDPVDLVDLVDPVGPIQPGTFLDV
nr:hypothetical protein CFP56_19118 [Quercus suber]